MVDVSKPDMNPNSGPFPGSPQIGPLNPAPLPASNPSPLPHMVDVTKPDLNKNPGPLPASAKDAAAKVAADEAAAINAEAEKQMATIESQMRTSLVAANDELAKAHSAAHAAHLDMPEEVKAHPAWKPLHEKLATVEAAIHTVQFALAGFPEPPKAVDHGSVVDPGSERITTFVQGPMNADGEPQ